MKKLMSMLLSIAMLLSVGAVSAFAAMPQADDPITIADPAVLVEESNDDGIQPYAHSNFSFSLVDGYRQDSAESYQITGGEDMLTIQSLTWTPTGEDVRVGFVNVQTGAQYGVNYSGGSISNNTITTENVPSGEYKIFVANVGGGSDVTGTVSYSMS